MVLPGAHQQYRLKATGEFEPQVCHRPYHDDDVTRPKGSMGVVVTLKSKIAASSASSGGNSKIIVSFDLSESCYSEGPATSEHMLASLPFKFPASEKYDAILYSSVTTTTTMYVHSNRGSIVLRHYA